MRIKIVKDKQGEQYSLEIFQGRDEIKKDYHDQEKRF